MAHQYQKRWVFTWNANENDQLIDFNNLKNLLQEIAQEGVFQKERGEKTNRLHYQGRFELKGPRTGKKQLLKLFSQLGDIVNLTFQPEKLYDSTRYCTKESTRVEGPWFVGTDHYRTKNTSMAMTLLKWQEKLLNRLRGPLGETYRDRKVLWIQDPKGGSGKSTFLRYLCLNKDHLKVKKLPLDKPDRLRMMICKIIQKEDVDAFVFDFTRTLDEETSIKSLFQIVEEIKNAHVVSAMYGNPMEVIFSKPHVIIFTNEDISNYYHYLSLDRWKVFEIQKRDLYEMIDPESYPCSPHEYDTRYTLVNDEKEKKD